MNLLNLVSGLLTFVALFAGYYYFYLVWVCRPAIEIWAEENDLELISIKRPPLFLLGPFSQLEVHRGRAVFIVEYIKDGSSTETAWLLCSTISKTVYKSVPFKN